MKIDVNGILVDATVEQELQIMQFQQAASANVDLYEPQMQMIVDQKATERGYKDATTCTTYYNSSNALWAAEAQAFIAWRDAVYAHCYDYLERVEAQEVSSPSFEDCVNTMPVLEWPEAEN